MRDVPRKNLGQNSGNKIKVIPDESTNGVLVKHIDAETGQIIGSKLNLYSQIFDKDEEIQKPVHEKAPSKLLDFVGGINKVFQSKGEEKITTEGQLSDKKLEEPINSKGLQHKTKKYKNNRTDVLYDDMDDNKHAIQTIGYYKTEFRENSTNQGSGFQNSSSAVDRDPGIETQLTKGSLVHGPKPRELGPRGLRQIKDIQGNFNLLEKSEDQPLEDVEVNQTGSSSVSEFSEPDAPKKGTAKFGEDTDSKKIIKQPTILVNGPNDEDDDRIFKEGY